jgi:hypothetical protein
MPIKFKPGGLEAEILSKPKEVILFFFFISFHFLLKNYIIIFLQSNRIYFFYFKSNSQLFLFFLLFFKMIRILILHMNTGIKKFVNNIFFSPISFFK